MRPFSLGGVVSCAEESSAASVQDDEEEAFEDAEGDVADVFGDIGNEAVARAKTAPIAPTAPAADTGERVPAAAPAKKSLASMREGFKSKSRLPRVRSDARSEPTLKDVNAR